MWFSLNYPPHHKYLTLPPISSSSSSGTKRLNGWTGKSPTQVLTHHNQDTKDKWVRLWPGQGVWTLHIALSTLSTINNPFFHYYNRSSFLCSDEEGGDKKVNSACYAGSFVTWPDTTSDTAGALIRTRKCVVWLLVYLIMMINIPERILAMIPLEIVLVVVFCSSVYDNVRPFITYHHPTPLPCSLLSSGSHHQKDRRQWASGPQFACEAPGEEAEPETRRRPFKWGHFSMLHPADVLVASQPGGPT